VLTESEWDSVRDTLRHLLAAGKSTSRLDVELQDIGWDDIVADDKARAIETLFEEHGRALATSDCLDALVGRVLTGALGPRAADAAVVYPCGGTSPSPSANGGASMRFRGIGMIRSRAAGYLIVLDHGDRRAGAILVPRSSAEVTSARAMDPDLGWTVIEGVMLRSPESAIAGEQAAAALALARRAVAHEMIGVTEHMLQLAVNHAQTRTQFGHPIGSFQAVKHQLADVYVLISAARVVAQAAWREEDYLASTAAKALAGRAHEIAAKNCQQVLGAMGFTWEHPLHRYIRRGYLLNVLLGQAVALEQELGRRLSEAGGVSALTVL
jgi:hypothetical protein